jgi:hypothetical protein
VVAGAEHGEEEKGSRMDMATDLTRGRAMENVEGPTRYLSMIVVQY